MALRVAFASDFRNTDAGPLLIFVFALLICPRVHSADCEMMYVVDKYGLQTPL